MTRRMPFLWIPALLIYLSGCAGYHPAVLPPGADPPPGDEKLRPFSVGETLRIVLWDGETVTGTVAEYSADEIVIKKGGYYARDGRRIAVEDIESVEVSKPSKFTSIVTWTAAGAAIGVIALVLFLLTTVEFAP